MAELPSAPAPSAAEMSFSDFLEKMRSPSASDLVRAIKHFIQAFSAGVPDPVRDAKRLQDFLKGTEAAFRAHPLWRQASSEELEGAGEALEKYIMTKLYPLTFAVAETDKRRDAALATKMEALKRFLKPEHLDIPPAHRVEESWILAMKELGKCDSYKAPRDKLVCALNCCRIVSNLLRVAAEQGAPPGADDFFPVLVYVVVRAAPARLVSNLEYVARFRAESRLVSEAEYFLTNLMSAVHFVETCGPDALSNITDEERAILTEANDAIAASAGAPSAADAVPFADTPESGAAAAAAAAAPPAKPGAPADAPPPAPPPAPASRVAKPAAELEAEGLKLVVSAEESGSLLASYPFLYYAPEDLLLTDVPRLLSSYKELVLRYESLRRSADHAAG